MNIKFLGTSHGLPEAGRRCSCTMIDIGGTRYCVDMGVPVIDDMKNYGMAIDSLKAVFITHMHGDHTDGLVPYCDLVSWYYGDAKPTICVPKLEAAEALAAWLSVHGVKLTDRITFNLVAPGLVYEDENIRVTAIPTAHAKPSYAYLVEAEGKSLVFSGDLAHPDNDFPAIVKERPIDLLVLEGAHFSPLSYEPHLTGCDIKHIAANHYSPANYEKFRELANRLPSTKLSIVTDGFEINL